MVCVWLRHGWKAARTLAVVRATAEEACLVLPGDGVLGPCAELRHTCDPFVLPSLANLQA